MTPGAPRRDVRPLLLAAGALLGIGVATVAAAQDSEQLFASRCGRCHGDAGSLAERRLVVVDDRVQIQKDGQDLRAFLGHHYAQLTAAEIEVLYEELRRQLDANP